MANSAQARKRARQSEEQRQLNASQRSLVRTHIKKVRSAVAAGDKDAAKLAFEAAAPIIDRMAGKNLIHANKASRHKSRMNNQIKALS